MRQYLIGLVAGLILAFAALVWFEVDFSNEETRSSEAPAVEMRTVTPATNSASSVADLAPVIRISSEETEKSWRNLSHEDRQARFETCMREHDFTSGQFQARVSNGQFQARVRDSIRKDDESLEKVNNCARNSGLPPFQRLAA